MSVFVEHYLHLNCSMAMIRGFLNSEVQIILQELSAKQLRLKCCPNSS